MARREKISFDSWYADLYGERWPRLKESLSKEPAYTTLSEGLLNPYYLDEASYLAAWCVGAKPGETILDMCAAPGGKTLVIALALGGRGTLIANDRSAARRARLHRVLSEYLPVSSLAAVNVTGHDATRWGLHEQDTYDRILLDAPCSSERHVINSQAHFARWSPSRSRRLATQAHAMLAAAYTAVKPSGLIVYSTCALSPLENDGVIKKLLSKRSASIEFDDSLPGEKMEYGVQITPDRDGGFGPMYISLLRK